MATMAACGEMRRREGRHRGWAGPGSLATPRPVVALPCGSESMTRTRKSLAAKEAARLMAVVVFPTPPFWLAMANTRLKRPY